MTRFPKTSLARRLVAGSLAGLVGGTCHAAVNEVDRRVLNYNADDLQLLGGVFTADVGTARRIGIGMHLTNAAIFGATYAALLSPRDTDDAFRKAMAFAMVEHVALFPLSLVVDAKHPHVLQGKADKFFQPVSFVEATLRHLALGYGLGKAYPWVIRALGE